MIRKINEPYYEMGFALMCGVVVDEELKNKIEAVLSQAKKTIFTLIDKNPGHYRESQFGSVYPHGKQTSFHYQMPRNVFDFGVENYKQMLDDAFSMKEARNLFVSDERIPLDEIKAFAQKAIEEEQDQRRNNEQM